MPRSPVGQPRIAGDRQGIMWVSVPWFMARAADHTPELIRVPAGIGGCSFLMLIQPVSQNDVPYVTLSISMAMLFFFFLLPSLLAIFSRLIMQHPIVSVILSVPV